MNRVRNVICFVVIRNQKFYSIWNFMVTKHKLHIKSEYNNYVVVLVPRLGQHLYLYKLMTYITYSYHCFSQIHFGLNTRVVREILFPPSHIFAVQNYVPLICKTIVLFYYHREAIFVHIEYVNDFVNDGSTVSWNTAINGS